MKYPWILVLGVAGCAASLASLLYATNLLSSQPMKKLIIRTPNAPTSTLYSQAVKVGSTIYVTGIPSVDPKTNQAIGSTIQEQTRQALRTSEHILHAAGAKLENVVEVQVLLAKPDDFAGLNEEYSKFFPTDPPTRTVTRLGPELPNILVSIRMTAVLLE